MKILTKEEEAAHYRATLKGGTIGTIVGTVAGGVGVWAASRRFPAFNSLTIPFKTFLVISSGTFLGIVQADRSSAAYDEAHNPNKRFLEARQARSAEEEAEAAKPALQRVKQWASKNRYPIVFGSWVASMGIALAIVNRNRYLTASQKLVQARVYAQGLTVAVLLASFAFETNDARQGKGRWETIKVLDPNDPEHKHYIEKKIHHERYEGEDLWKDMVAAEERRINERKEAAKRLEDKKAKEKA
ncbi:hypothetical protein BDY21DRAFT_330965 [Lineolata rhizophorae]|uniref:HIG1 domain-containing protein n=1 Tax=Lineolata rhizophorae TaxID=578093 RepID=A0A6A6PEP4_9PEZI|nr:hypothetical protein BDY21DRAFT_330965 [Lineolata rhizophorae]